MVPFAEFPRNPDDRCYTLMRSLMIAGTARYLQVRVAVEPDLLEKTNEVRDFLSGVQVASDVQRSEFQNTLLAKLRFGCQTERTISQNFVANYGTWKLLRVSFSSKSDMILILKYATPSSVRSLSSK